MTNSSELLAPVGSWEAMVAAIQNGADAIYLGGKLFSARAYANNFDLEELERAVDYAHVRGVKVYVTVNTLLSDKELPEAISFLKSLYEMGVDAVILQDLGIASLIKRVLPKLEIHASTQMVVHNLPGVQLLADYGFERIVLAREVSLEDIKYIDENCPVELEAFIHGALCICYSGLCLMSSLIGGRSGNRGRCAQPCRLKYTLVNDKDQEIAGGVDGLHLLSPRDLNMIEYIPDLMKAGIDSFKIEGRMKRPEYVATVIRNYRQAIDKYLAGDKYEVKEEQLKELKQIFNRDFTTGYFYGFQGQDLMSYKRPNNRGLLLGRIADYDWKKKEAQIQLDEPLRVGDGIEIWVTKGGRKGLVVSKIMVKGKEVEEASPGEIATIKVEGKISKGYRVFKTNDSALMQRAIQSFKSPKEQKRIPLNFKVYCRLGEPLTIEVSKGEGTTGKGQTSFIAEEAIKRPLTEEVIYGQLDRLGNTPYEIGEVAIDVEGKLMVPMGEINEARRLAIADLEEKIVNASKPKKIDNRSFQASLKEVALYDEREVSKIRRVGSNQAVGLNVLVTTLPAVKAALQAGADLIYFGGDNFRKDSVITPKDIEEALNYCESKGKKLILSTPRILHRRELDRFRKFFKELPLEKIPGILVSNLGLFQELKEVYQGELYADYPLNIFNSESAQFFAGFGSRQVTLSPELNLEQLRTLVPLLEAKAKVDIEYLAHGQLTMMVSEYCGIGSVVSGITSKEKCPAPCKKDNYGLRDRMNLVFPIEVDQYCHMHLFNPKELALVENIPELVEAGIKNLRLELKRDEAQKVGEVVRIYKKALEEYKNSPKTFMGEKYREQLDKLNREGITKGHLFRGVM